MNKKINTLLFILGATVFNIFVTIICLVLLGLLYSMLVAILPGELQSTASSWGALVIFSGAIVLSIVIYRHVFKKLTNKINMENYFDPILGRKRPPA
ncbi:MAG: leader peptide processing enzyme [Treponema sp.]|jgi:membrane protein implicated in regulation of membrane protease activity|nr:leader peptide processing enzyme [Treponema sp.]